MIDYQAVFIDVDNTLIDFDACSALILKKGLKNHGIICDEKILRVFYEINYNLWQRHERQEISLEELYKIRFASIFKALGINDIDGPAFEEYFKATLNSTAICEKGAIEFLEYISKKYPLYAATNGPYRQQIHRIELAGMSKYFADIFVSEDIGASKPDIRFFQEAFSRIRIKSGNELDPKYTIIIGDSLTSDVTGGQTFNMDTCFYNRKKSKEAISADYTITSLDEIKSIL